jgi:hypothetical protein
MAAVGDDISLSGGGQLPLERILSAGDSALLVLSRGGSNVLAQVIHKTWDCSDAIKQQFKLRVSTIGDKDDTGAWVRQQYPISSTTCSVHDWNQYATATWRRISNKLPGKEGGPGGLKITQGWILSTPG